MREVYKRTIDDENAPERLHGLEIKAVMTSNRLDFIIDMPDNPTPNELGYFKWLVGEMMDKIKENVPGIGYPHGPTRISGEPHHP